MTETMLTTHSPFGQGFVARNVWGTLVRDLEIDDGLPSWAVRGTWVKTHGAWGRVRDVRAGVITVHGWRRDDEGRAWVDTFTLWPMNWGSWEAYDPDQGAPVFGEQRLNRYERDFEP